MEFKLSILIPTTPDREESFKRLYDSLLIQIEGKPVEICVNLDNKEKTIGQKRQELLDGSKGQYICYIDSDDEVAGDYVDRILKALEGEPDCCSLTGVITWDGTNPEIFEHSIKYNSYKTNPKGSPIIYERFPNHLNTIKRKIAINYTFIPINHGEDTLFAEAIHKDQALKTETKIEGILYHYKFKTVK